MGELGQLSVPVGAVLAGGGAAQLIFLFPKPLGGIPLWGNQ